jgi:hypothetical protein
VTSTARSQALLQLSPRGRQAVLAVLVLAAVVGLAIGLNTLVLHLTTDPLGDVHAYYDAGARLNAGQPLYQQPATTDESDFYRYPPLLAIAFRPLALLPYEVAAAIWEGVLLAAFALTVWRLGRRLPVLLALGMLAMPTLWALAIGQAQVLVTLLLTLATPFGVALAGYLKLTPWLAGIYWLARRDRAAVGRLLGWIAGFGLLQLLLAPQATVDFLTFSSLAQVGDVRNLSPFEVSPLLWAAFVVLLAVTAWRLAPTRFGWPAAVVLTVMSTPRLLTYQLSTLIAGLAPVPPAVRGTGPDDPPVPVTERTTRL